MPRLRSLNRHDFSCRVTGRASWQSHGEQNSSISTVRSTLAAIIFPSCPSVTWFDNLVQVHGDFLALHEDAHTRARAFTCIYTAADCDLTFADNQGGPSPYYPQGCEQVPNEFMPCEGWAPGSSTNPTQKAGDLSEPRFPRDMGLMATVRPLDDYSNTYVTSSSNASKWMLDQVALPSLMICSLAHPLSRVSYILGAEYLT